MSVQQDSSSDTTQTEGEGTDCDKPPHEQPNHRDSFSIPLPPPEAGTYEKQPGHTIGSLKKFVMSTVAPHSPSPVAGTNGKAAHLKQGSMHSISSGTISSPASPTGSDPSDWGSAPSTRPPSQAPSRAPSMSAGTSGGKLLGLSMMPKGPEAVSYTTPSTPMASTLAVPNLIAKAASTPSSPAFPPPTLIDLGDSIHSASTSGTIRPKAARAASVHSQESGREGGHKFTLKDLLASGPKLARKSSQRSTSSRRSDTDRESIGGGRAKSAAGDSATSLSQKYGVCQKVAIGKGATSVVRLAHKWDRSEEKLYAVKVCASSWL